MIARLEAELLIKALAKRAAQIELEGVVIAVAAVEDRQGLVDAGIVHERRAALGRGRGRGDVGVRQARDLALRRLAYEVAELGAAQAAPGRQHRDGFEQVSLARPILPEQADMAAIEAQVERVLKGERVEYVRPMTLPGFNTALQPTSARSPISS